MMRAFLTPTPLLLAVALLAGCVLAPPAVAASSPRRWSVALAGPDRVAANRDYIYTVTLTNDGGTWPFAALAQGPFRLAFDLEERYGEGTVGIEDIIVHPAGPQASDGSFPCAVHGGCSFRRSGSQVEFMFTKQNVRVAPVVFDLLIHTASVFRPGDSFRVSAILQGGWNEPIEATEGSTSAIVLSTFPLTCVNGTEVSRREGDVPVDCLAWSYG